MLYVPRKSPFISTKFFVLNLDGWFSVFSADFLLFDVPLLYYYNDPRSLIIYCLFRGDIYLSSVICISLLALFCGELVEIAVILFAVLLLIKSSVASAHSSASMVNGSTWWRLFSLYFPLKFYLCFYLHFSPFFLAKDKIS